MNSTLYFLLKWGRRWLDILSLFFFSLMYGKRNRVTIPPIHNKILSTPATELALCIRNGTLSSRKVVETFIQRIQDINSLVNCYVDTRFEEALREADEIDALVSNSSSPIDLPFLGVPFTVKDSISAFNLSHSCGLLKRVNKKGKRNGVAIESLINSGGILLAVSNVPELCMWVETHNVIYGRTNNPYHLGRIVGGSSGGEAAGIASGASLLGIGSDIGGSIRIPSFCCGIFGHKPSRGEYVSNDGNWPGRLGQQNKYLVTGPMVRYAADLLPLYKALIGNPESITFLRLNEPVNLSSLKLYYMENDGGFPLSSPVHSDLITAQKSLLDSLQNSHGLQATKLDLKEFFYSFMIWITGMGFQKTSPPFASALNEFEDPSINPFSELLKWPLSLSDHTLPGILNCILEAVISPTNNEANPYLIMGNELRTKLNNILGADGVLLYPSNSTPAPYHGEPLLKPFNFAYTAIFNILGNPVTQVPLGLSPSFDKVPLGIQLVSGLDQDRNSLALALEIERAFGGWIPPS